MHAALLSDGLSMVLRLPWLQTISFEQPLAIGFSEDGKSLYLDPKQDCDDESEGGS